MIPKQLRRLLMWRGAALLFIVFLIGAIVLLSVQIQATRRNLVMARVALEGALMGAVHNAAVHSDLVGRAHDINRIKETVPQRREIGGLVAAIESEAQRWNVDVRIPTVDESVRLDDEGNPILPAGPLDEVELNVVATGAPTDLISFFHGVSYVPYLQSIETFEFSTDIPIRPPGSAATVPGIGSGEGDSPANPISGDLAFKMVLKSLR